MSPLLPFEVLFKKLRPDAILPSYAKAGDAGMDMYAVGNWSIPSGATQVIDTGIAMAIPHGYFGSGRERSGLAAKGIRLGGGVIDSGYRGEVKAILTNLSDLTLRINHGDRIFQLVIQPCVSCHAVQCNTPVPPKMHMCAKHWRMVPKALQDLIWHHYRAGQEVDKKPTLEYLVVAFTSISCVALQEHKPLPSFIHATTSGRLPSSKV